MALLSHKPVGNESLERWEFIGSGGFGYVYKARHTDLGFDVAVKILRDGVSHRMPKEIALSEEVNHMEKASCEFVLRVYGIYKGCPPIGKTHIHQSTPIQEYTGIVMEFMERGSVQSLLNDLGGPPPWPLAFRLAHQIALGMNFLHSKNLLHHDLKPSNVLVNDSLQAKLADFGLCQVSTSVSKSNTDTTQAGSYKYRPPESFSASYEPVRDFDIYSYGILLWSIVTGKEPYAMADSSRVALRIPMGDRPSCKEIDQMKAEGLKDIVDLMERCWNENPSKRPPFKECLEVTENVFSKHKKGIHDAVHQVLKRLDSPGHHWSSMECDIPPQTPECPKSNNSVDDARFTQTRRSSMERDHVDFPVKILNNKDKAKFVDDHRAALIQDVSEVMAIADELGDMVHHETYCVIEATATNQDKMRVLYRRTLHSGGVMVKAAFYDALQKHNPQIVARLSSGET